MSRLTKFLALFILVLFVLACSTVTQPFNQAKDLAETAQSLATAMPFQTLQSLATQISTEIPSGTLEALPSMVPSLEALGTNMPDIQGFIDPTGAPVSEWKGIPVMPQATAGQENTDSSTYSYKADATVKDAQDFYGTQLKDLGWKSFMNMPGDSNGSIQVFQKDSSFLTVTAIEQSEGKILVILAMG
jgi:hypothetical protein